MLKSTKKIAKVICCLVVLSALFFGAKAYAISSLSSILGIAIVPYTPPADAECNRPPRVCTGVKGPTEQLKVTMNSVTDGREQLTINGGDILTLNRAALPAGRYEYKGKITYLYIPRNRTDSSLENYAICSPSVTVTVNADGKTAKVAFGGGEAGYDTPGSCRTSKPELKLDDLMSEDKLNEITKGFPKTINLGNSNLWQKPGGENGSPVGSLVTVSYKRYAAVNGKCNFPSLEDKSLPRELLSADRTLIGADILDPILAQYGVVWDKPVPAAIKDPAGKSVLDGSSTIRQKKITIDESNGVCQMTIEYNDQLTLNAGTYKACLTIDGKEQCKDFTTKDGKPTTVAFEGEQPANWKGSGNSEEPGDICDVQMNSPLSWILCPILQTLELGVNKFYTSANNVLDYRIDEESDSAKMLKEGWVGIRNIANILFVISFLFVIISQTLAGKL